MAIFTFTNITVTLVSLYLARRIYWETTTGSRRRAFSKQHGCQSPKQRINTVFPTYIPTFGLDFVIRHFRAYKCHTLLEEWAKDLKSANAHTVGMRAFGLPLFLTEDPQNIKAILATDFDKWSLGQERIEQMSSYLGHGIFTNEGAAWKHSREMLRPCFERSVVADVSLLNTHTERFFKLLPVDGTEVDLQPLLHELTLDIASAFLFGRSTDSLDRSVESKDVRDFIEAFEYCNSPLENDNVKRFGYLGILLPDRKTKRSIKIIQDFASRVIDEEIASKVTRIDKQSSRYMFLDSLTTETQDRTIICSELLNILLAGRDTTAALLSNIIWELPRHPAILARLRAEITTVIGADNNTIPTYEQLKDLKYLRAVINESQRIYPIVPANSREALQDTTLPHGSGLDGLSPIVVPKGAYVVYHTYSMHRRTSIFGLDADEFNPDRWLEPGFRPGWAYIPFSGGPRVCIGQNFALTETMFVVVRLLQGFELERKDFGEWREKLTLTCTGEGGCRVGLRRREA